MSTNSVQYNQALKVLKSEVKEMSFGEKLKVLRGNRSQEVMAKELNITKSSLAMYEQNKRVPRDEVKIRIANYFGKTVQELFYNYDEHV